MAKFALISQEVEAIQLKQQVVVLSRPITPTTLGPHTVINITVCDAVTGTPGDWLVTFEDGHQGIVRDEDFRGKYVPIEEVPQSGCQICMGLRYATFRGCV